MKSLRRALLVLIALLVIAAIVAVTFPAQYAWRLVADRASAVHLSGVSGTIWNGHAASIAVFDEALGALDWQLDATPLLRGDVRAQLQLHGGALTASGRIDRGRDGAIDLHDASFRFPASMAAPALDIPALTLLGEIDGTLTHARLQGAWPDQANGQMTWHNAAVAGAAQAQFGDLQVTFSSTAPGVISGVAHDLGGPLQLNGTFKISAGSFDADATLAARDGNPQVVDALRYIGQPQADGSSHLLIHGQLFKLW